MLTRFRVNNFKSLLNFEFKPAGLNLLLGANNAGKTNLCSAMRFLGLTSGCTLHDAVVTALGERWNLTNFYVAGSPEIDIQTDATLSFGAEQLKFSYQLRLTARKSDIGDAQSLTVAEEVLKGTDAGRFADTVLLENNSGRVRMLHEEGFAQNRPNSPYYVQAVVPTDSTMLSQLYELENNPRAILFRRFLRYWAYYNFSPEFLRQPTVVRDDGSLLSNGANFSRAFFALHNEKPRLEKNILEMLRLLEPRIDLLSFLSPDPEHVHLFLEDEAGHRLSTRGISDGTLRFLALAYVILMADQEAKTTGISPVVIMEEPENGLYVGHLKPLIERIDASGESGQFIFTSHSPYFIDLFDNMLDGIHVIKSGCPSSSVMKPDVEKVGRLLDDMSLGEMHFQEMLG